MIIIIIIIIINNNIIIIIIITNDSPKFRYVHYKNRVHVVYVGQSQDNWVCNSK